jgi:hypothetical protein
MAEFPSPLRITRLHVVIISLFIFVASLMTFVNAVNADFVNWDDDVYVVENTHIHQLQTENIKWMFSSFYYYSWIPVTLLSHALDVALWGMNPKGHHLTSVLLHAFNAVWIFLVGTLLLAISKDSKQPPDTTSLFDRLTTSIVLGSAIGAFLYAMHPLRVESVAWVSGRKDLLCAFFLFPSLGFYLIWKTSRGKFSFLATHIFFALALLSKPMAAPFPIILMLVEVWWLDKHSAQASLVKRLIQGKALLLLMGAVAALVTFLGASGGTVNVVQELNLLERFLLPVYAILFYLLKTVMPFDLSPVYPDLNPVLLYVSPVVFVGIMYLCFVLIEKQRAGFVLAFFAYVIILLPTFIGLSSGLQPIADRYTYLSTISIFLLIGGSAEWLWRKSKSSPGKWYQRELIFFVLFVLCGINAYRTVRHTAVWKDSIALWTQALRYSPASRDEYEARRPYLRPSFLDAYTNLGTAYYTKDEKEKAVEQFTRSLALDLRNADSHYNLGNLMFEQGDMDLSLVCFQNAVACDSTYAKAFYNMGIVFTRRDSTDAAMRSFKTAARLGFPDAQRVLKERGISW